MVLRIFKMIATSGFQTASACTKFVFCHPTEGAYSAPPGPLAPLMGPTFKGKGREERGRGEGEKERDQPPFRKFLDPPLVTRHLVCGGGIKCWLTWKIRPTQN